MHSNQPVKTQAGRRASGPLPAPANRYFTAVLLSWLLPGSGHFLLGHRVRGVLLGVLILGTFWTGECILGGRMAVTSDVHPVFYALQLGTGASAFAADQLWGEPRHPDQLNEIKKDLPRHLNLGILFTSVSGLLNVLAVLHVLDPRSWREADEKEASGGSTQ